MKYFLIPNYLINYNLDQSILKILQIVLILRKIRIILYVYLFYFFEFNNKIEPNIPITNQVNDDSDCNTYYYII